MFHMLYKKLRFKLHSIFETKINWKHREQFLEQGFINIGGPLFNTLARQTSVVLVLSILFNNR